MDIAPEAMDMPEQGEGPYHELGRVIGRFQDARAEEEAFYVVAPIELDSEIGELFGRKRGTGHLVAAAVDAIGAIVDADVGEEHFQQRDAAAVGGEAVAASGKADVPEFTRFRRTRRTRRRAGDVVFCRIGQDVEFRHEVHTYVRSL